jgi:hypothetical protein
MSLLSKGVDLDRGRFLRFPSNEPPKALPWCRKAALKRMGICLGIFWARDALRIGLWADNNLGLRVNIRCSIVTIA